MMKSITIIMAVLFLGGCILKNTEEKNKSFDIIDITNAVKDEGEIIYLSEFAKNVDYIFLETKEECLIGSIDKVMIDDSLVFVSNKDVLLVFNQMGKFVQKIGNKGRGPGEYSKIMDFSINKTDNAIYVYDSDLSKIIVYQYNGKIDSEFRVESFPSKITCVDDKYLVFVHSRPMYTLNDNFCFSYYSFDGKLMSKNFSRENENVKMGEPSTMLIRLNNYCDSLTFWEVNLDTIYRVSSMGDVTPRYKISFMGDDQNLPVTGGATPQYQFRYSYFLETENYLFFIRGAYNNLIKHIFYNKKTNEAHNFITEGGSLNFRMKYGGFTNDFDGGMPFLPFDVLSDGSLYNTFFPFELKNFHNDRISTKMEIKNTEKQEFLLKKLENSGENENPVIMLVTL